MFRILKNGSKKLANLKVAIALLFIIGILIALGTFIEQDQTLAFYKENYPETKPIWGFIDWKFLINLNLNQIYTAPLFLFILLLFGSSLLACTFTTQLPVVRKFRLWQFFKIVLNTENLLFKQILKKLYRIPLVMVYIKIIIIIFGKVKPIIVTKDYLDVLVQ